MRELYLLAISIHAPPRGATPNHAGSHRFFRFQFTPLREGRPLAPLHFLLKVAISIHAPPRGATLVDASVFALCKISIHAPPRGATRKNALVLSSTTFQFTPLREGRPGVTSMENGQIISIHAPPRGATWRCWEKEPTREEFQFTPLREGRQRRNGACASGLHFNSRPSARGDGERLGK